MRLWAMILTSGERLDHHAGAADVVGMRVAIDETGDRLVGYLGNRRQHLQRRAERQRLGDIDQDDAALRHDGPRL